MGLLLSHLWRKASTMEVLQKIEDDLGDTEKYRAHVRRSKEQLRAVMVAYSLVLYVAAALAFYYFGLPNDFQLRLLGIGALVLFPAVAYLLKRFLTWYYDRKMTKNEAIIINLKKKKEKILEEVQDKETYKVAKNILEKFAPEKLRRAPMRVVPTSQQHSVDTEGLRVRLPVSSTPARTPATSTPLSTSRTPPTLQVRARPGPPLPRPPLPRPVLPRERGYIDRMLEYLVGDGPSNRYALICIQCQSHNGMALKEEFEYFAFRCCYCFAWNPARKQRPSAPRLPVSPIFGDGMVASDTTESTDSELEPDDPASCGLPAGPGTDGAGPASAVDEQGSAEAGPSPAEAEPSPAEVGPSPAEAGPSPAEAGPSPAEAGPSPAEAGPSPVEAGPSPAKTGLSPAEAGSNPAEAGRGSAKAGDDSADVGYGSEKAGSDTDRAVTGFTGAAYEESAASDRMPVGGGLFELDAESVTSSDAGRLVKTDVGLTEPGGGLGEPGGGLTEAGGGLTDADGGLTPGDGLTEPGGELTEPGGELTEPGGGLTEPSGELPEPGGGLTEPGGELTEPGGELTEPGGELPEPGGGLTEPGGELPEPGGGLAEPGGGLAEPCGGLAEPCGGLAEPCGGLAGPGGGLAGPCGGLAEPCSGLTQPDELAQPDVMSPHQGDSQVQRTSVPDDSPSPTDRHGLT